MHKTPMKRSRSNTTPERSHKRRSVDVGAHDVTTHKRTREWEDACEHVKRQRTVAPVKSVMVPEYVLHGIWKQRCELMDTVAHLRNVINELQYYIKVNNTGGHTDVLRQLTVR